MLNLESSYSLAKRNYRLSYNSNPSSGVKVTHKTWFTARYIIDYSVLCDSRSVYSWFNIIKKYAYLENILDRLYIKPIKGCIVRISSPKGSL